MKVTLICFIEGTYDLKGETCKAKGWDCQIKYKCTVKLNFR